MPIGDIGGYASELIVTCKPRGEINKGDVVALVGDYEVATGRGRLFGVAMEDSSKYVDSIPILVRGVCKVKVAGLISVNDYGSMSYDNLGCMQKGTVPTTKALVLSVKDGYADVLLG